MSIDAMKKNSVQLQSKVNRSKAAAATFQLGAAPQSVNNHHDGFFGARQPQLQADGAQTTFQTSLILNKRAVLSIQPMQFKSLSLTQGGRTVTIESGIADKYLFCVEPAVTVTLILMLTSQQPAMKTDSSKKVEIDGLRLHISLLKIPHDGRFKTLEIYPIADDMSRSFRTEIQQFLSNFKKETGIKGDFFYIFKVYKLFL